MANNVYKDSLSAWRGLIQAGGLDIGDRDADLVLDLIEQLQPGETDLETVLQHTSTDMFLHALFSSMQPFVYMYKDILEFFERANTNEGQCQWKVRIGDDFVDFEHFQEFLDHWKSLKAEFDIPALDQKSAFILNHVSIEDPHYNSSIKHDSSIKEENSVGTNFLVAKDVDHWIVHCDKGRYQPFPASLHPDNFPFSQ